MLGTYALSSGYYDAYYGQAQKVRTLIARDFEAVFQHCDLVVGPTSPTTAFGIGERMDDPLAMYASDICTIPVNLAALPGISIPSGLSGGLPVGLQLIGPAFSENQILSVSWTLEQAFGFDPVPPRLRAVRLNGWFTTSGRVTGHRVAPSGVTWRSVAEHGRGDGVLGRGRRGEGGARAAEVASVVRAASSHQS